MDGLKLVSAYVIIAVFSISVVFLSAIVVHLAYNVQQLQKYRNNKGRSQIRLFIFLTIAAIILFTFTLLLVIAISLQIVLIDAHSLRKEQDWLFEYMEYATAICDTMAHLCVVFVFVARFQYTFNNNTIFGHAYGLLCALYICTALLTVFGVIIIVLICVNHTVTEIIVLEIIWEILVDVMCLWILYLFMSKLYQLLKFSIQSHMKSGKKTDFVKELIEATRASIEQSKSDHKNSKKDSKRSKELHEPKSMYTMTIDGMKIDPVRTTGLKHHDGSPDPSPGPSPGPSPAASPCPSVHNGNMELTITKAISDHDHTDNDHTDNEQEENGQTHSGKTGESAAMDLIGVMTKMTILVTFAVLVSVLGVVGNVFIEMKEMQYIEKHDVAVEELWAEILPVLDAVITSLMLYMQFKFTHRIYRYVLGRLDVWFLTNCLKFIQYVVGKKEGDCDFTASFLVETQSTKTLETAYSTKTEIV